MNRFTRIIFTFTIVALGATVLVACDGSDDAPAQSTTSASAEPSDALPATLLLDKSPDGAQDVLAVQKSAKAGDTVTLRGRVGGNEKPLAENRALVMLVDPSVVTCERMPGDACPTPWDACCDPDAVKKSASIQVVGADGRPLKATLSNVGGIAPLKELIVTGKVKTAADSGALVIDATGIYVKG